MAGRKGKNKGSTKKRGRGGGRKKAEEKKPDLKRFESDDDEEQDKEEAEASKTKKEKDAPNKQKGKGNQKCNKTEPESIDESSGNSSDDNKSSSSNSDNDDDDDDDDDGAKKKGPFFSDENKDWLKPKQGQKKGLLDSDEEEEGDKDKSENESDDDDDDDDEVNNEAKNQESGEKDDDDDTAKDKDDENSNEEEEEEDLLEIERESRRVDEEMEAEKKEAEEEMRRTIRQQTSVYHLPTPQELEKDVDRVVPPSEYRSHIDSIVEVLAEFKERREPGRARNEYIQVLGHFMAELYGYLPELVEYFLSMFGPTEALEFIDASDKPRPLVIRTNTLKVRRKDLAAALIKRGVSLDPLAHWSKVGLKIIESPVPIGATPEYLGGHYMLQSAASMCPVLALGPEPKEKILDMSAAPGGKTSYIAQLMKNTGVLVANDLKKERQKATVANMHRLGVKNVITCTHDGRKLGSIFKNRFDRILLDAPCSGLGVISRDPSVKVQRTMADVQQCAHLQKELLLAAIDALKFKGTSGGVMVYSTCSVSIFENEEVVNYALSKRDIRLVDTGLEFGKPGYTRYQQKRFHPSLSLTRRLYPHVHNMDGFYVAKIQKLSDQRPGQTDPEVEPEKAQVSDEEMENDKQVSDDENNAGKGKKGGDQNETVPQEDAKATKKRSLAKVSVPPPKPKPKKQRQNAKVTQPRRIKKSDAM